MEGLTGTRGGRVTRATRQRRMSQTEVRVLTVDDQVVFRRAAQDVIAATPGFEPVGDAESGEDALGEVERLRPELVLLDVRMPGIGGVEAARRIAAAHPETVVVLISIEDSDGVRRGRARCAAWPHSYASRTSGRRCSAASGKPTERASDQRIDG